MKPKSPLIRIVMIVAIVAISVAVFRVYDEVRFRRDAEATRVAAMARHQKDEFIELNAVTPIFIRQKIDAGKNVGALDSLMRTKLQGKVSEMIHAYGSGDFSAFLQYRYGNSDVNKLLAPERIKPMIEYLPSVTSATSELKKMGIIAEERVLDYSSARDVVMAWWYFVAPKMLNDHGESYFCIGCWNGVSVDSFDFAFITLSNQNQLQRVIQKLWPSKYYMGVGEMFTHPTQFENALVALCRVVPRMDRRQYVCPMIIAFVFDNQTGNWIPQNLSLQLNTTSVWYVF